VVKAVVADAISLQAALMNLTKILSRLMSTYLVIRQLMTMSAIRSGKF
jgi:hypothetical protein